MSHSYQSLDQFQLQTYIEQIGITLPRFMIKHYFQDDLISFLQTHAKATTPTRSQCLVNLQDHWIAMDIEKKSPDAPLSIIILDAANNIHKIGSIISSINFVLEECGHYELFHFCSSMPLQRDGYRCLIYAIEQSQWASLNPSLHAEVKAIASREESIINCDFYTDKITEILTERRLSRENIDMILISLRQTQIFLIDYSRIIENVSNWQAFFSNTQAEEFPEAVTPLVEPWLIERGEAAAPNKRHNLRIEYCEYQIHAQLGLKAPIDEREFVKQEILKSLRLSEDRFAISLQLAIATRKIYIIKALLRFNLVDVNDLAGSGQTALDRAAALPEGQDKTLIIGLLTEKGARNRESLARHGFFASTAGGAYETPSTLAPAKK